MDESLIEEEIRKRVNFKMNEFRTSFKNHMNTHKFLIWDYNEKTSLKHSNYFQAYKEIEGIIDKEVELPTALDGEFHKRVHEKKEKLVDELSERLLKKGQRDYTHLKSFINNKVCGFISYD